MTLPALPKCILREIDATGVPFNENTVRIALPGYGVYQNGDTVFEPEGDERFLIVAGTPDNPAIVDVGAGSSPHSDQGWTLAIYLHCEMRGTGKLLQGQDCCAAWCWTDEVVCDFQREILCSYQCRADKLVQARDPVTGKSIGSHVDFSQGYQDAKSKVKHKRTTIIGAFARGECERDWMHPPGWKRDMNINVPQFARDHFWEEPPDGAWEFCSFRFPPPCKPGDPLYFRFDGRIVAEAVCDHIEPPGQSKCDSTGRFERGYKVFWRPESFVDQRVTV